MLVKLDHLPRGEKKKCFKPKPAPIFVCVCFHFFLQTAGSCLFFEQWGLINFRCNCCFCYCLIPQCWGPSLCMSSGQNQDSKIRNTRVTLGANQTTDVVANPECFVVLDRPICAAWTWKSRCIVHVMSVKEGVWVHVQLHLQDINFNEMVQSKFSFKSKTVNI